MRLTQQTVATTVWGVDAPRHLVELGIESLQDPSVSLTQFGSGRQVRASKPPPV